jgi:hypothetical protein
MTAETLPTARTVRRWVVALGAAGLFALAGCRTDKEAKGSGVSRPKNDPLVQGPNLPKQNLPLPDRATGAKADPLTTPTGGKAGYNDDPDRFKGTYLPGTGSTPAALAGRIRDGSELKIADTGGVKLVPAGGTVPEETVEAPADVQALLAKLDRYGVARGDRFFERDGDKYVFRAAALVRGDDGARRQYTGVAPTMRDAVQQVLDQLAIEK